MGEMDIEMIAETLGLLVRTLQQARSTIEAFETDLDRLIILVDHLRSILESQ